jgi:hypothetical protein
MRLQSPDYAERLLEGLGDLVLLTKVRVAADQFDENPADYAVTAVARFSQEASDEAWLAIMNTLERAPDPASACLRHMVEWALTEDARHESARSEPAHAGCTCGGQGDCRDRA